MQPVFLSEVEQKPGTAGLIVVVHRALEAMSPDERLLFVSRITENFCPDCGRDTGGLRCYCTRDE